MTTEEVTEGVERIWGSAKRKKSKITSCTCLYTIIVAQEVFLCMFFLSATPPRAGRKLASAADKMSTFFRGHWTKMEREREVQRRGKSFPVWSPMKNVSGMKRWVLLSTTGRKHFQQIRDFCVDFLHTLGTKNWL